MAIEITGLPTSQVHDSSGGNQTKALQNEVSQQQTAKSGSATTDTVTLTASAAKLHELEQNLSKLPVVDQDRVASLRKAIANGEYNIDPTRTAEKFVQLETVLFK